MLSTMKESIQQEKEINEKEKHTHQNMFRSAERRRGF
jgi:hypothetical protein